MLKTCTKCGQLILRKILKNLATRCHILRLKCTKFDFGWGFAPDPAGGADSVPPDPIAGLIGPTSKGRGGEEEGKGGEGKGREKGRKGKGRRGKGRGKEGRDGTSPAWSSPDLGSTGFSMHTSILTA